MGMLNQWIKKLQHLFAGDLDETTEHERARERVEQPVHSSHTYGRFESDKRKNESKVVYQYPKAGKFRFPVIDDGPMQKIRTEQETRVKRTHNRRNFREEEVSKAKDEGNKERIPKVERTSSPKPERTSSPKPEFKLSSIPSPVYGFQSRESTKSVMSDSLSVLPFQVQETSMDIQPEVMEKVLMRAEIEKVPSVGQKDKPLEFNEDFQDTAQIKEKKEDRNLIKETEVPSQGRADDTRNEEIVETLPKEQVEAEQLIEEDLEVFSQKDEQQGQLEKLKETKHEEDTEQAIESISKFVASRFPEEKTPFEPIEQEEQGDISFAIEEEVEGQLDKVAATISAPEPVLQSKPTPKQTQPEEQEISQRKTSSDKVKKTAVPFNVMMLPQDRNRTQATKSTTVESESKYLYPSIQLLNYPETEEQDDSAWLKEQGELLEETLQSFHVDAKVVHATKGPSVTRFEIQPGRGVKVTKVTGLTDDMKLALAAKDIRIEAPIPGKNTIGIEVPNRTSTPVFLREILRRASFVRSDSPLTVALGLDISGQPIVTDLKKMPHGLVAGATGSGKSVCINSMLVSLLFKANPDEVKLMLIDPKMVELAPYNGLPHLVTPVITDAKQATAALKWVVLEMERRYELFSQKGVRDVGRYNEIYSDTPEKPALPYILVVIDELADLMMVSPSEVEDSICRIAQKARACGIHLLLATQRPSVDVITGLIKANIPTRIAFSVSSQTDSRTILDMGGAERLLGRGDMLFHENGSPKPVRVQGTFVSDQEIEDVVAHVKKQREPAYLFESEQLKHVTEEVDDEHFEEACYFVIEQGSASASSLQRKFRVGYNRAARLIDLMEERGIVSEAMGSKPRHVLVDVIELEEILHYQEG
ncbi:DNA translocase FtsK [Halalkalibacter krulwichiae]|uniref:DNA translocase SftA n=1 Tax=Halalkalibacter krulwichiae TaxID=199441 RepID=A0A1X9MHU9_9BACI|nr:DNA translocase FtsK [Halalkalibacter krulwichiae]ARK31753.1 DNA translocase SftA [Halalkalibacter krulwichiae]